MHQPDVGVRHARLGGDSERCVDERLARGGAHAQRHARVVWPHAEVCVVMLEKVAKLHIIVSDQVREQVQPVGEERE